MSYRTMRRHGGILNACYYVKEAHLKRPHAVGFQRHDIPEKTKLWQR